MDPRPDPEAPITGYETNGADTRDVAAGCKTIVMRLYRDRAVVLRQHKLGEADRLGYPFTPDHGVVRAGAKGFPPTRSKFGARLEPFAHIDAQLHPGRNLDIVTQVVSIDAFATDIVSDYGRYTCGCAMLETAERLAGEERAPAPALHKLTVSALRAVADGYRPRDLLLDAYLLRAMEIAGWAPALTECARCAAPGPHRAFHVAAGGSGGGGCPPPRGGAPARRGGRQRVCALPARGVVHAAGGGAGSDVSAARRRLGFRAGRATVVSQPGQRAGGRTPAVASRTSTEDIGAGGAAMSACAKSKRPGPKVEHPVARHRVSLVRQDEAHEQPGGRLSAGG